MFSGRQFQLLFPVGDGSQKMASLNFSQLLGKISSETLQIYRIPQMELPSLLYKAELLKIFNSKVLIDDDFVLPTFLLHFFLG